MAGDVPHMKLFLERISAKVERTFSELHQLWTEIGYTEQTQAECREQAYIHLQGLLDEMVAETEQKKKQLLQDIALVSSQADAISKQLTTKVRTEGHEVMPLHELKHALETYVQDLQQNKEQRITYFKELRSKERDICKYLGVQPINIDGEIPSEENLNNFKLYLDKREAEKTRLGNIFQEMRYQIIQTMDDLGITPSLSFEHMIYNSPENFVFTNTNMLKLQELRDQLQVQLAEAKSQVEEMKESLISLWKYLEESDDVCERFLESCSGYSVATIDVLSAEIKRCKDKRRENLDKHVALVRSELVKLWDLCKYGEAQRNQFVHYNSNVYTEDLLVLHDLEADRLRQFYKSNREIFSLLDERENVWKNLKQLLQRENNPDRLHNRGGQLLLEEKERKAIRKQLPKIETKLKRLVEKYEESHREPFTINGLTLENFLADSYNTIYMEHGAT